MTLFKENKTAELSRATGRVALCITEMPPPPFSLP